MRRSTYSRTEQSSRVQDCSTSAQNQVENEASPNMRLGSSTMSEDRGVSATNIFEGIGQDSESIRVKSASGQEAFLIGSLSHTKDGRCQRNRFDRQRSERVAKEIAD